MKTVFSKGLALLLAITMLATLAACSSKSKEDLRGTVSNATDGLNANEDNAAPTDGDNAAPTDGDVTVPEPTEAATLELGSSQGNVYTNEFLGIGCRLGSEWIFQTEEELAETNNLTNEMLGEDYQKAVEKAETIYDMSASTAEGDNINVIISNMGLLYGSIMDEAKYVDVAKDSIADDLSQAGMEITQIEVVDEILAGSSHKAMQMRTSYMGIEILQKSVCCKKGNYMAVITFSSLDADKLQGMIDSFYAL